MEEYSRFVSETFKQVMADHEGRVTRLRAALAELLAADEALDRHWSESWPLRRRQMAMRRAARLLGRWNAIERHHSHEDDGGETT